MLNNDIVDVLYANRLMRTDEEIDTFEDALVDLSEQVATVSQQQLARLYLVFDDDCEEIEVMYGLMHFIEDVDFEVWFRALASVLPAVRQQAPEWSERFMKRILNSERVRPEFRLLLTTLPATQQNEVHALLEVIRGTNPEKSGQIDAVLR